MELQYPSSHYIPVGMPIIELKRKELSHEPQRERFRLTRFVASTSRLAFSLIFSLEHNAPDVFATPVVGGF